MSEPIQDGREVNEAEEGFCQFVVTGGDAAVDFDPAEEVFDLMAAPVVTAMEAGRLPATALGWDTAPGALGVEAGPEDIGIEALVRHDPATPRTGQHRADRVLVVLWPGSETERHRPAARVDEGREFGVQSALGTAHRLGRLTARRIGAMLMELDVRAIQVPQFAFGVLGQHGEHPGEQAIGTPAPVARIDRGPRSVTLGQIPPRQAGAQHEKDGAEHQPVILRWAASSPSSGTSCNSRFATAIRSIFLAAPTAAPGSSDDLNRTWSDSDSGPITRFHHFAKTP